MINEKRYVLIPVTDVTDAMRDNTIPYGVNPDPLVVDIEGIEYEVMKWRGDKPSDLWSEYPVMDNTEMSDYIYTHATRPIIPQPT